MHTHIHIHVYRVDRAIRYNPSSHPDASRSAAAASRRACIVIARSDETPPADDAPADKTPDETAEETLNETFDETADETPDETGAGDEPPADGATDETRAAAAGEYKRWAHLRGANSLATGGPPSCLGAPCSDTTRGPPPFLGGGSSFAFAFGGLTVDRNWSVASSVLPIIPEGGGSRSCTGWGGVGGDDFRYAQPLVCLPNK